MSKKQRKFEKNITGPYKEASMMKHQDLQRACIVRGIGFHELVEQTTPQLQGYFIDHYYDKIDNSRLDAFDEWREEIMRKRGHDEPYIRLGFIGQTDVNTGEVISIKKPKKFKKPKNNKKRLRNEKFGIFQGTKKALSYQCAENGYSLKKTIRIVKEKFPDAKDKSIGIWMKKALRALKPKE